MDGEWSTRLTSNDFLSAFGNPTPRRGIHWQALSQRRARRRLRVDELKPHPAVPQADRQQTLTHLAHFTQPKPVAAVCNAKPLI
jgi:hypothetical protein